MTGAPERQLPATAADPDPAAAPPAWLAERLAALPRELAPGHDPWPAIVRRIAVPPARTPRWRLLAVAAGVVIGAVNLGLGWQAARERAAERAALDAAVAAALAPYRQAGELLDQRWPDLPAAADAETARAIAANRTILRLARQALEQALARSPDDAALHALLQTTLEREADLQRTVQHLDVSSI